MSSARFGTRRFITKMARAKQDRLKAATLPTPPAVAKGVGRINWRHLALISAVALVCYLQTTSYGFVFDDQSQILENPRIRNFSNLGLAFTENFWAFHPTASYSNYYRPLQTLSYMLAYAIGALNPMMYHLLNVALNLLACLALYWTATKLMDSSAVALWGSLFFAAHPMHTESVTWVAGITDVGCGLFYFLSLGAYLRCRRKGRRQALWLGISLGSFLLALYYKETALTLPLAVILLDYCCESGDIRRIWRESLKRVIPFFVVLAVYMVLRINALGQFSQPALILAIGPIDRMLTMLYLLGRYLQDLLIPFKQNAFHVFLPFTRLSPREWAVPFLLLASAAWLVWSYFRHDRKLLFWASFTILGIAPALYLSGIVGPKLYAERYLYIPSSGFCLLAAALFERYGGKKRAFLFVQSGIVLMLSIFTLMRNPVWKDDKTFYTATLAVSPDAIMLRNSLGRVLFGEGDLVAARQAFEAALASDSRSFVRLPAERAVSLLGLSAIASVQGRLEEAWNYAVEARDLVPQLGDAYEAMGVLRLKQGNTAEAEKLLRYALSLQPNNAAAHSNLGNALLLRNELQASERELRLALQLDPRLVAPRVALASLLFQTQRAPEAVSVLQEALRLDPANPQARQLLTEINSSTGK